MPKPQYHTELCIRSEFGNPFGSDHIRGSQNRAHEDRIAQDPDVTLLEGQRQERRLLPPCWDWSW